jgi:phage/plasmid-like protein (TIGR03299 family)
MSHEFDTGFTVRTPAWHAKETGCTVLADFPGSLDEAREHAGLTWEPRVVPSFRRVLTGMDEAGEPVYEYVEVPESKHIERDDTGAVIGSGLKPTYTPILNKTMFEIVDALVGGGAKVDAAGSLRHGSQVWVLAKLDEPYTLPGDDSVSYPYVGVTNSHDGSSAMRAMSTQVRIVCMNTVQASWMESARTGLYYEFRHTSGVKDRIDEAMKAIQGARQDAAQWVEMANRLVGLKVTTEVFNNFVARFIPEPPAGVTSDVVKGNIAAARAKFSTCYNSATNDANRGTALALVNASVEYLDHIRGYRNKDTLLGRQILRPEPLKAQAFKMALEVCSA